MRHLKSWTMFLLAVLSVSAAAQPTAVPPPHDMTIVTIEGPQITNNNGKSKTSPGIGYEEALATTTACGIVAKFTVSPSWKRAYAMAREGRVDAIIPTNKKPDRIRLFHFPAKPFKYMTVVLFTLTSYPVDSFSDFSILNGKRLGIVAGASLETSFDAYIARGTVRRLERATVKALYEGLLRGRLDFVAEVEEHSGPFLKALNAEGRIKALEPPIGVTPLYIAISKKGAFAKRPYSDQFKCLMGES